MKLDPKQIRHLTSEDWRVLTAVEQGSRNHLVVPTSLIISLANARGGSQTSKSISTLAKSNLIARVKNASYDGYRLAYGGLDYLALHAHLRAGSIYSIGNQIGVGKESDVYVVASQTGRRLVLKIHRLGRTSFRTVKNNREYLRKGGSGTWMYMSTLAARKEWTFMRALRESGFVVPEPVAWNRHTVVMELIDAFPLRQISHVPNPAKLYGELIDIILRLVRFGLIHADFNEFNLLVQEHEGPSGSLSVSPTSKGIQEEVQLKPNLTPAMTLKPILIDFPQALSIDHPNAEFYFDRDIQCIKTFFERRFHFVSDEAGPSFEDAKISHRMDEESRRLDIEVEASGFSRKMAKELEKYMKEHCVDGDAANEDANEYDSESGTSSLSGDDPSALLGGKLEFTALSDPEVLSNEASISAMAILRVASESRFPSHDDMPAHTAPGFAAGSVTGTIPAERKGVNAAKAAKGWAI